MRTVDTSANGATSTETTDLVETILAVLPFPKQRELIDRIRARHPRVKIIWHELPLSADMKIEDYWYHDIAKIPHGKQAGIPFKVRKSAVAD